MKSGAAKPGSVNRSSVHRPYDDHYPTPREAVVPIIKALDLRDKIIWEPACGDGAMARVLSEYGAFVLTSNLTDRGCGETGIDFLTTDNPWDAPLDAIVTNPPYTAANEFVLRALDFEVNTVAMLLRTKFLESAERYREIFRRHPPSYVYQFIDRVKFFAGDTPKNEQPGWSNEAFAWFVWQRIGPAEPVVRWIKTDDGRQTEMFTDPPEAA